MVIAPRQLLYLGHVWRSLSQEPTVAHAVPQSYSSPAKSKRAHHGLATLGPIRYNCSTVDPRTLCKYRNHSRTQPSVASLSKEPHRSPSFPPTPAMSSQALLSPTISQSIHRGSHILAQPIQRIGTLGQVSGTKAPTLSVAAQSSRAQ